MCTFVNLLTRLRADSGLLWNSTVRVRRLTRVTVHSYSIPVSTSSRLGWWSKEIIPPKWATCSPLRNITFQASREQHPSISWISLSILRINSTQTSERVKSPYRDLSGRWVMTVPIWRRNKILRKWSGAVVSAKTKVIRYKYSLLSNHLPKTEIFSPRISEMSFLKLSNRQPSKNISIITIKATHRSHQNPNNT